MSAAQQKIPAAKADEPTMEEILASIRKIIADEGATAEAKPAVPPAPRPQAARPVAAPPPAPPKEEVLDLAAFSAPHTDDVTIAGSEDLDFIAPRPAPVAPPPVAAVPVPRPALPPAPVQAAPAPVPAPLPATPPMDSSLLSAQSNASVTHAFHALNHVAAAPAPSKSVDEMVREMLRPLLKSWLDDNLPSLVERLVRAEIERVARGGR